MGSESANDFRSAIKPSAKRMQNQKPGVTLLIFGRLLLAIGIVGNFGGESYAISLAYRADLAQDFWVYGIFCGWTLERD